MLVCAVAGLVVVAAVAGAVLLFSGDSSEDAASSSADTEFTVPDDAYDDPGTNPEVGGETDSDDAYSEPPTASRSFEWLTHPRAGWSAKVPAGEGWGPVRVHRKSGDELIVTEQRGDDATVQIWTTPYETPRMSLEPEEKAGSQWLDGRVHEIVFAPGIHDDLIADCGWDRCVDYLVDMGGGGFAVLVSAPTVAEAKRIGRPIARSIGYSD